MRTSRRTDQIPHHAMSSSPADPTPEPDRLTVLSSRASLRRGVALSDEIIRVVLVDDHALVREGVRLLLHGAPDITVVGEAGDGIAAVQVAERTAPDVVVLDLDMPRVDGHATLHELRRVLPAVRVLILTVHGEQERLIPLLEAGAHGYLTKEAASQELVEAIRVVAAGEVYVRPAAARLLATAIVPRRSAETPRDRYDRLSSREKHVLRAVAEGYSGAEISRALGVSTKTVDAYKRRIETKLTLSHRTEYVRFALEAGVLGQGLPATNAP
jgi:DNA-binding NarL/FixJ family response regulator